MGASWTWAPVTVSDSDAEDEMEELVEEAELIGFTMGCSPCPSSLAPPRLRAMHWSLGTAGTTMRAAAMSGEALEDMFVVVRWMWRVIT